MTSPWNKELWPSLLLRVTLVSVTLAFTGCILAVPAIQKRELKQEAREEKMWDIQEAQRQQQKQQPKTQTQKPLKASDF